jgi:hypothetical protein
MFDIGAIGSAVGAFAGAAASGQVAIQPDAAQDALTEIGKVKHEIQDLLQSGGQFSPTLQLGANPVGEAMARKSADRWGGGGDSFMVVLKQLLEQTEKAENALKQSIQNYVHTDTGHAAKFNGQNG